MFECAWIAVTALAWAALIQRAIWAGDKQTGITIMQMDEGLDTGDMLYKVYCDIAQDETSTSLYAKLMEIAPPPYYMSSMD